MRSKFDSVLDIYRTEGLLALLNEIRQFVRENGLSTFLSECSKTMRYHTSKYPPIDNICLYLSRRELQQRKQIERDLDDIFATVGTAADDYTPEERYRGFGVYRSLMTTHAREPLRQVVDEVKKIDPEVVVEIGTLRGGSLYIWSRAFSSARKLVSIDIDDEIRPRQRLFEVFSEDADVRFVCGDAHADETVQEVTSELSGDKIDFLYIDGKHTYRAVKNEFEAYRPLMADDGIIGFDDASPAYEGVWEFWCELESEYRTETYGYVNEDLPPYIGENITGLVYL